MDCVSHETGTLRFRNLDVDGEVGYHIHGRAEIWQPPPSYAVGLQCRDWFLDIFSPRVVAKPRAAWIRIWMNGERSFYHWLGI